MPRGIAGLRRGFAAACLCVLAASWFTRTRLFAMGSIEDLRPSPAKNVTKASRRRPFAPRSSEERLLWILGCELWCAGRDVALAGGSVAKGEIGAAAATDVFSGSVGTTSHLPTVLQQGGSALQEAGGALLDGHWRQAWQHLEAASRTSQEYWPASGFAGLIDLVFIVAEPVSLSQAQFGDRTDMASASLEHVARGLDVAINSIDHNIQIQYPHREKAEALLISAAEILQEATYLLQGSDCHLPKDPRRVGMHFHDDDDDFWEESDDFGNVYDPLEYISGDMVATLRIRDIQKELIRADRAGDLAGRRKLLNRLVREHHPDQNPGKEEEVRPVFEYCLRMLRLCKDAT
mmetsp:Transcript_55231/g.103551  ORF Transcript_55231/g.103551 Transcript_55231/m.103551 type:complete len:348 (+) Transcript_55231:29-1072(+)